MVKDWNVLMLLGVSSGYRRGCALQAGGRLKIFTVLLDALAAMGLLLKTDSLYANTEFSRKFLVAGRPEFPALFALNMLVGTEHGRSYSRGKIIVMLERTGVADIAHHVFTMPNDSSVISGIKKKD